MSTNNSDLQRRVISNGSVATDITDVKELVVDTGAAGRDDIALPTLIDEHSYDQLQLPIQTTLLLILLYCTVGWLTHTTLL